MLVAGVAAVKFESIGGDGLLTPRVVGGGKCGDAAAGVGELEDAAQVVKVGVVDLVALPGLLYVNGGQAVGADFLVSKIQRAFFLQR